MGKSYTDLKYAQILMGLMPAKYLSVKMLINASAEMQQVNLTAAMVIKLFIDEYDQLTGGKTTTEEALSAETQKKKGKKAMLNASIATRRATQRPNAGDQEVEMRVVDPSATRRAGTV